MKVILIFWLLSVPDEDYSNILALSVPDEGYSNILTLNVPDESYSNILALRYLLKVILIVWL
jgi:hypothetical protein